MKNPLIKLKARSKEEEPYLYGEYAGIGAIVLLAAALSKHSMFSHSRVPWPAGLATFVLLVVIAVFTAWCSRRVGELRAQARMLPIMITMAGSYQQTHTLLKSVIDAMRAGEADRQDKPR